MLIIYVISTIIIIILTTIVVMLVDIAYIKISNKPLTMSQKRNIIIRKQGRS